jgi:mono/diheme cytochrome c family protein
MTLRLASAVVLMAVAACAGTAHSQTPLERGTYLMRSIVACGNCHTENTPQGPKPGMELAGGTKIEEPNLFIAAVPNITPDPETGIGKWTDQQIIASIREGRRPDGSIIGPPMPIGLYRGLSDEDVQAIVAYMRTVKPVVHKVEKSQYKIPLPPSYGPPVTSVPPVPRSDKMAYGAYLAGPAGHCTECHAGVLPNGAPDFAGGLVGGRTFYGPWGESRATNITPQGIGHYTDAQLKSMITTGVRPDGSRLKPPMAVGYYKNMTPGDLTAIIAYLRSLKPM